jgi:hypothetical protein
VSFPRPLTPNSLRGARSGGGCSPDSPGPMAGHLGVLDRGYGHKKEPRPLN